MDYSVCLQMMIKNQAEQNKSPKSPKSPKRGQVPNKHFAQKWTHPRTTRKAPKKRRREDKDKEEKVFCRSTRLKARRREFVATRECFVGRKKKVILLYFLHLPTLHTSHATVTFSPLKIYTRTQRVVRTRRTHFSCACACVSLFSNQSR